MMDAGFGEHSSMSTIQFCAWKTTYLIQVWRFSDLERRGESIIDVNLHVREELLFPGAVLLFTQTKTLQALLTYAHCLTPFQVQRVR